MRLFAVLLYIALALLTNAVLAGAGEYKVLVIPKGVRVQYWDWVKQGAEQAGAERNVKVIYRGPRISDSYKAQQGIVRDGIAEGVDAIVIAPNHRIHLVDVLEEAVRSGIPVVIIDSDIDFAKRLSFVASDNYLAGLDAADHLLSMLEGGGTVLLLRYMEDNASTLAREKGFEDGVRAAGDAYTLVATNHAGASVGDAFHATLNAFQEEPKIKGVFSPGEFSTIGGLKALDEMHLSGRIKFVGFDYTETIQQALAEGKLDGVMVQSPYQIGYEGVMAACDVLDGKQVEKRIVTETKFVTHRGGYH